MTFRFATLMVSQEDAIETVMRIPNSPTAPTGHNCLPVRDPLAAHGRPVKGRVANPVSTLYQYSSKAVHMHNKEASIATRMRDKEDF